MSVTKTTSENQLVKWIAWGISLFVLFLIILFSFRSCGKDNSEENSKNLEKVQPVVQTSTINVVGQQKIFYRFSDYPNGEITIYIGSEATYYPVGGEVKVKTPSRKIHTFKPGEQVTFPPENAGEFTFSANTKNATGIDVWQ